MQYYATGRDITSLFNYRIMQRDAILHLCFITVLLRSGTRRNTLAILEDQYRLIGICWPTDATGINRLTSRHIAPSSPS